MYRYMNMNPKGNNVEDCAIRSISVAEGISWDKAYEKLSTSAMKLGLMLSDVNAIEHYLNKRYDKVKPNKTVGEFVRNHPIGIYLITMPGHITVLKDGINYDTFDCSDKKMWEAWRVK